MDGLTAGMICASSYKVYMDARWPAQTGIGVVLNSCAQRRPAHVELVDLRVQGRIGSPFSPLAIARELKQVDSSDGVFWNAGFVPPTAIGMPAVVTVHDLTHLHFYTRFHKAYYDYFLRPLYRRCSAIVCVSEYTRREFIEWSGISADKVHVVYNGVSKAYHENQSGFSFPHRYIFYPGNHRSYKNLDRLIAAYAASTLRSAGVHLVMTGKENPALIERARAAGIDHYLHFLGRVEDAELPKVYKAALLVAFVSLYEGFGLPIVEAMASGVPVLTSNVSAMPEIAGDAALIVDPRSVEAITKGLNTLAGDQVLRSELVARGKERVIRFDWDRSAHRLWDIIDRARASPVTMSSQRISRGTVGQTREQP